MIKVAVGIIRKNGKFLVCQRRESARYGLKWEFPGGKIEDGESATLCLKRELREELGIDVEVGELYHRHVHTYPDAGTFEVFYHLIPHYNGEPINKSFHSIQWVREEELESIDMLEGNREVVKKLTKA